ncbi:MAG: hypothetical protein R2838_21585 [Caldilineaceae bacterium]
MPLMLAIAERVDKLWAICVACGACVATQRLIDGRPALRRSGDHGRRQSRASASPRPSRRAGQAGLPRLTPPTPSPRDRMLDAPPRSSTT